MRLRGRRDLLLLPLLAAAGLLIAAELLPLYEIRAVTVVPEGGSVEGGSHHGYALAVIGLALVPMALGAVRGGSRPAAVALVTLAAVALGIVLLADWPATDETGLIGRTYAQAEADPATGFYVEAVGAALALGAALATLALTRRAARASRERARPRGARAPRRRAPAGRPPPGGP